MTRYALTSKIQSRKGGVEYESSHSYEKWQDRPAVQSCHGIYGVRGGDRTGAEKRDNMFGIMYEKYLNDITDGRESSIHNFINTNNNYNQNNISNNSSKLISIFTFSTPMKANNS